MTGMRCGALYPRLQVMSNRIPHYLHRVDKA